MATISRPLPRDPPELGPPRFAVQNARIERPRRRRTARPDVGGGRSSRRTRRSALAGFEARVGLVDDVDAALAAHDAAVLVALLGGLQRVHDLHDVSTLGRPDRGARKKSAENRGGAGG